MSNPNAILPHNPLEGPPAEIAFNLHDGSDERVSIIIVHKDKPEYLNILLQSITVTSFNNNYEIVVVDNGSGKESQDFLDDIQGEVKVLRNKENIYWGPAATKGVSLADKNSKYFIFMHADVVVLNPAWIDLLINISEHQNSGMVGLELQHYYMQNQKVDFVQEWCLLMSRECWKDIGPFPETLPQIGTSFIMTMRAQNAGYKPQVMRSPVCHHYRVFGLDINQFERLTESAMVEIPRLMRAIQTSAI